MPKSNTNNLRPAPLSRFVVETNTTTLTRSVTVAASDDIEARKLAFENFRETIPGYNDLTAEVTLVPPPTAADWKES